MSNKEESQDKKDLVLPGEKIAVIEEFLPDETCYEEDGEIFSGVLGSTVTDRRKHKITVIPKKQYMTINNGDVGVGRVLYVKKQIASVEIFYLNDKIVPLPFSAILHVSEVSRQFVRNMYEVTRPGDWINVKITRNANPVYIGMVGLNLGVIIAYCNHCGQELEFKRRNLLGCNNCGYVQPRITSKQYGSFTIPKSVLKSHEKK